MRSSLSRGFTLIELLVVIAIIGILASIVLAMTAQSRIKAVIATNNSEIVQLRTALEGYAAEHGVYPIGAAAPPGYAFQQWCLGSYSSGKCGYTSGTPTYDDPGLLNTLSPYIPPITQARVCFLGACYDGPALVCLVVQGGGCKQGYISWAQQATDAASCEPGTQGVLQNGAETCEYWFGS